MANSDEQAIKSAVSRLVLSWRRVMGAVVCAGILVSLLVNAGLCLSEFRFLHDRDYFKSAIDVVIRDPVDGVVEEVPGMINLKLVHSQRYSSAEEFLNDFPDCCKFIAGNSGDGGPEISLLDRFAGVRVVEVSYEKRYTEYDGSRRSANGTAKVAVTSCGKGRFYR